MPINVSSKASSGEVGKSVFISYRHSDCGWTLAISENLRNNGYDVFYSQKSIPGGKYEDVILNNIKARKHFLVILSQTALDRCDEPDDWVRREIETALDAGRNIVPVVLEGFNFHTAFAQKRLPGKLDRLKQYQAIDVPPKYFDKAMERLRNEFLVVSSEVGCHSDSALKELNELDETARSPEFVEWQTDLLKSIYRDILSDLPSSHGIDAFPIIAGVQNPILIFKASGASEQFQHRNYVKKPFVRRTCRLLNKKGNICNPEWQLNDNLGEDRQRYFELLSATQRVRQWDMPGFALTAMYLNNNNEVFEFEAELCTYGENCLTSHLLGNRMHRAFREQESPENARQFVSEGRPQLIMRKVDTYPERVMVVLASSTDFHPLISVQAMVVYRDLAKETVWKVVAMERGSQNASAAGVWQFPPAGGFEIFGSETDEQDLYEQRFDLREAIIREFLEEIFGATEMDSTGPEMAKWDLENSQGYRDVAESIRRDRLHIHLMGVVMDLVSLRSEISFLIVIDDPTLTNLKYGNSQWLAGSAENKKGRLKSFPLADIERKLRARKWHSPNLGMFKLLADLSEDKAGWLRQKYKDFPALRLSKEEKDK